MLKTLSIFLMAAVLCGAAEADELDAAADEVASRFRVGPFFELTETRSGGSFWAVRPFYSRVYDPASENRIADAVWPVWTWHRHESQAWWHALLFAYGTHDDVNDDDAPWTFTVFPLYTQGQTRQGEDYWALFPIYGHVPHILLMDDINFAAFPVYLDYKVNGRARTYWLWPFFSKQDPDPEVEAKGVFPFYGAKRFKDRETQYVCWPVWNAARYTGARNPGESWMAWPLYGRVNRTNEQQTLVLPPFFSHAQIFAPAPAAARAGEERQEGPEVLNDRWRMPWPFYQTEKRQAYNTSTNAEGGFYSPNYVRRSYWPFYGSTDRDDEHGWYAAWPLLESDRITSKNRRTEHGRFFPFWRSETVYKVGKDGRETELESYTRVWPFWSRLRTPERIHWRVLELNPIRHSGAIERNWAPFWTFYEKTETKTASRWEALWGLLGGTRAKPAGDAHGTARKEEDGPARPAASTAGASSFGQGTAQGTRVGSVGAGAEKIEPLLEDQAGRAE